MTIKRMIFRAWVRTLECLTLAQQPKAICHLPLSPLHEKSLDIVTIAFNNVELIQYQEQFLRKFIQDPYHHIKALQFPLQHFRRHNTDSTNKQKFPNL